MLYSVRFYRNAITNTNRLFSVSLSLLDTLQIPVVIDGLNEPSPIRRENGIFNVLS